MFREKEHRSAFIRIDRLTEVVALCFCAIVCLKKFQLPQCLHPFRYHLQVQSVSHADDGADDSAAIRAVRKIVNERAIELKCVYRKSLQVAQIGIAGSEII